MEIFRKKSIRKNIPVDFELFIESPTDTTIDMSGWGAQYEQSSYPTSYIPTTSSSATRVADVALKTSATALIGQTEGTLFADFLTSGLPSIDQYFHHLICYLHPHLQKSEIV